jgi:uncharacterized metal-binding protein YceD (DUF177 family)
MTLAAPPLTSIFDLNSLTERAVDIVLLPSIAERAAIAEWLEANAVERMEARIRIEKKSPELYAYDASFDADVVQACVVTLEPVRARLKGEFHRRLRVPRNLHPGRRARTPELATKAIEIAYGEDEEAELLESTKFDIAAPILEELILALDPYPRAPGAALPMPETPKAPVQSPFAVLKGLKDVDPTAPNKAKDVANRPSGDQNRGKSKG